MPGFDIQCRGIAREMYWIEAKDEAEALQILNQEAPKPYMTEVTEIEVVKITLEPS